ncbi:thermonuclease family protein [Aquibacillus koreensis]|uniref:Thermonuclease family protein n=1 Tax=Aquibacillus koreensis TaxID=279446 RepID=A0A9X4AJ64_9BACI|nr:thermonuclease family protein [Aquibacillus koreensis]MCT2535707.1 thermonuclease family protein [Aquibacillus koreensis]MDC3420008.1 thermonuclease family protein [Aquibacillus koreensis]
MFKKLFFAILFGISISGCMTNQLGTNEKSPVPEEENTTTAQNETTQSELVDAKVNRVVDGDTMKVNIDGKEETVRLLLVDTPETKAQDRPVQKYGPEASSFAENELTGQKVRLEYDGPRRDKYDRLLAYLWVEDKLFNELLLEEGFARLAYIYDPPYTNFDRLMKAQNRAKEQQLNIWSVEGYVTERGFED